MVDESEGNDRTDILTSSRRSIHFDFHRDPMRMRRSSVLSEGSHCTTPGRAKASKRSRVGIGGMGKVALLSMLAIAPGAVAETCISLSGSTACPAFASASISTNSKLTGFFPFLNYVSDTASFDQQLTAYVATSYVQQKYQTLLGCGGIDLTNTTNLYARFTTTVICNAIIQNSKDVCGLSAANSRPVCADTCAQQAESEAIIIADSALCTNPNSNAANQIRADFTNCALPANSLSGSCIEGIANEPDNCGFGNSTVGLCSYCGAGGLNSTDTCCYNSKAESRCVGVVLPTIFTSISLVTTTPTASSVASATGTKGTAAPVSSGGGLPAGTIAGIAIGSIAGAAILVALVVLGFMCSSRRGGSRHGSILNQPTPPRKGQGVMSFNPVGNGSAPAGYEVLPGGRIARMSALEGGQSGDSPTRGDIRAVGAGGTTGGSGAGYGASRRRHHDQSSSDDLRESPDSDARAGVLRPPPTGRRNGSLSSGSALGGDDPNSPLSGSGGDMSSPLGVASQQSEQLPFFKDYYSQDEIHPGDKVATLWAYQPRAGDEFLLERGDMLKVVGIWDDGWATGVMLDERADEWEAKRNAQRDSGVSNGSGRRESSPPASGEIKAFPLVCVCLPEHWRKTIEGDGSTETGSSAPAPQQPQSN